MECFRCRKKAIPDVEYAGNYYCKRHFLELMEKRVRKNLRVNRRIDVKKEYVLVQDDSSEAMLAEYFLKKIFGEHLKFKIAKRPLKGMNIIFPTNLDEQAILFMDNFLAMKKEKQTKIRKGIFVTDVLLQKEVELLCEILKIKFIPKIKKDVFAEMEKKYPGTKFSLFQSKLNLEKKSIFF